MTNTTVRSVSRRRYRCRCLARVSITPFLEAFAISPFLTLHVSKTSSQIKQFHCFRPTTWISALELVNGIQRVRDVQQAPNEPIADCVGVECPIRCREGPTFNIFTYIQRRRRPPACPNHTSLQWGPNPPTFLGSRLAPPLFNPDTSPACLIDV